jgi:hypothetical protein
MKPLIKTVLFGIALAILTLFVLPALVKAEPHAWVTHDGAPLPPNPEQPKRGSFNRMTTPPVDASRLDYFRAQQELTEERAFQRELAERSAPRTEINVHPTVVIERREHRNQRGFGAKRWAR